MAIEAPFYSANDLNAQPGNAALGGAQFDPTNKAPFGELGNTISQLISENAQAENQRKAQIFQNQQQEAKYKNDALARVQEYAHQDAVNQYQTGQKNLASFYQNLRANKISAFNQKDAQGNDISMQPVPSDKAEITNSADALTKNIGDGSKMYTDPNFQKQQDVHDQLVATAGVRAAQYALLQQKKATTTEPSELKNIQDGIDELEHTPASYFPQSHLPKPIKTSLIPDATTQTKLFPDQKGLQSGTDDKKYIPASYVVGIPYLRSGSEDYTTAMNGVNKAIENKDVAFTDPTAFAKLQADADTMADLYGNNTPHANIGQVVKDANGNQQVVLNPDKRQVAYGMHLQSVLQQGQPDKDEDSEDDKALEKANIREKNAQAAEAEKKVSGESTKPLTPEQQEIKQASANTIKQARAIFNPAPYEKGGRTASSGATTDKNGNTSYGKIDGMPVGDALKEEGLNPDDWQVFNIPDDIKNGVGVQKIVDGKNTQGGNTGKQNKTGEDERVDRTLMIYNPKTKDVRAMYFQKGKAETKDEDGKVKKGTPPKLLSIVNGRDYVTNAPNSKYQWGVGTGAKVNDRLEYEKASNQDLWDAGQTQSAPVIKNNSSQPATVNPIRPTNIPATAILAKNGLWVDENKKVYDKNGKLLN